MSDWVDLTQRIHEGIPVRPLHGQPTFEDYMTIDEDGTNSTVVHIETHVGTHMDAPAHFMPADEYRTIDEVTPEEMIGTGVVLDFSDKEPGTEISREEMETEAETFDIRPGEFVILKLGLTPRDDEEYLMDYVAPEPGAVEYLLEKDIGALASEGLNVDRSGQSVEEHTAHYLLFEDDVLIVEGLTNLDDVTAGRCDVVCTPLPYVGRDGSQVRFLIRPQHS